MNPLRQKLEALRDRDAEKIDPDEFGSSSWTFRGDHPIKPGIVWAESICGNHRQQWECEKDWYNTSPENQDSFRALAINWDSKYYDEQRDISLYKAGADRWIGIVVMLAEALDKHMGDRIKAREELEKLLEAK